MLVFCPLGSVFAQSDTAAVKKEKMFDQYISLQINGLVNEVFNYNNNNANTNTNPYLLNYFLNSKKTGWGIRAGLGYASSSSSTGSDSTFTHTTAKSDDLEFRIGIDKAYDISKKWSAGIGFDFVLSDKNDHFTSVGSNGFGFDSTATQTVILQYGGGPMGWLRYHISGRILVGTEASFYYTTGSTKQTVTVDGSPGVPTNNNNAGQATISAPITFFLIVKL